MGGAPLWTKLGIRFAGRAVLIGPHRIDSDLVPTDLTTGYGLWAMP